MPNRESRCETVLRTQSESDLCSLSMAQQVTCQIYSTVLIVMPHSPSFRSECKAMRSNLLWKEWWLRIPLSSQSTQCQFMVDMNKSQVSLTHHQLAVGELHLKTINTSFRPLQAVSRKQRSISSNESRPITLGMVKQCVRISLSFLSLWTSETLYMRASCLAQQPVFPRALASNNFGQL